MTKSSAKDQTVEGMIRVAKGDFGGGDGKIR
jgi:hypothetical protein